VLTDHLRHGRYGTFWSLYLHFLKVLGNVVIHWWVPQLHSLFWEDRVEVFDHFFTHLFYVVLAPIPPLLLHPFLFFQLALEYDKAVLRSEQVQPLLDIFWIKLLIGVRFPKDASHVFFSSLQDTAAHHVSKHETPSLRHVVKVYLGHPLLFFKDVRLHSLLSDFVYVAIHNPLHFLILLFS